jgi:hypothetical protein
MFRAPRLTQLALHVNDALPARLPHHPWPRPWIFSVLILPLGIYVGFIWTALPFLLGKAGVSVEQIANISALLQLPPVLMFLWTPVVDVKLRRRIWLVLGAIGTALSMWLGCNWMGASHLRLLTAILLAGGVMAALVPAGCGGLMVTTLSVLEQSKASAWNQAGNFGGGFLGAAMVLWLFGHFSAALVGFLTAALVFLPALTALTIAEPPSADTPWFRGRLAELRKEGLALLRAPKRRWGVLLLLAPGSTCAALILLPALASSYRVGGNGVLWTNGVAGGLVLVLGSLCGVFIPGDWDRRITYAGAGLTNALAALVLLTGNRPSVYLSGTLLYLLTTGLCSARFVALVVDVIGSDFADRSTWYSALLSAGTIPIAFMVWLEGKSFHRFGPHGVLWTDMSANLLVLTAVALVFLTHGGLLRAGPATHV